MKTVNVHKAKTELSRILAEVEAGAEVIIARNGKPVAKVSPINADHSKTRVPGMLAHLRPIPDGFFFDPLPEEELDAWEGGDHGETRP